MTPSNQSLQRALFALQAGRKGEARRLLTGVLETDPGSEEGWLWLSQAVDAETERRFCLARVLAINSGNDLARERMDALGAGAVRSPLNGRVETIARQETPAPARTPIDWLSLVRGQPFVLAVGYLFVLTLTELFTLIVNPQVGLWANSVILVILIVHTTLVWRRPYYKLFLSLIFVPLIRLVSLSMPLAGFPLIYWYLVTSVPLLAASFLIARLAGFSGRQIGLGLGDLSLQIAIGFSGLVFGTIEYWILVPEPPVEVRSWGTMWLSAMILLVCTGFTEELIFRGIMQRAAQEAMGSLGIYYVAALFAMLHVGHAAWLDTPFVFVVALFFSWIVVKTRSILGVTIAHGLTNIVLFLILPLLRRGVGG